MSVLKNKTAVITGSTRGVGFETAKKLARQFNENFKTFSTTELGKSLIGVGPKE